MPDRIPHRIKPASKRKNRVYDIDSEPQAVGMGQSPVPPTNSTSIGPAASNSGEDVSEETPDLVRIAGRLVSRKRSAAIRAAIEKWSQTPKRERQSVTELARKLGVSRQYVHRLLTKNAPADYAPSRVTETRKPLLTQTATLEDPRENLNCTVNRALVDSDAENIAKSTAPETTRKNNAEILSPYRFAPGRSGNPGGRPKWKALSTAYRKLLDEIVPGTNHTYAEEIAMGQIKAAARGKTDAAREICDRTEGKVPRPIEAEGAWYSLIVDASEIPAAFKPVRRITDELPAPADGEEQNERTESTESTEDQ